jgi:Cupin superfamily protein
MQLPDLPHFIQSHWLKTPLHLPGPQVDRPGEEAQIFQILLAASESYQRDGSARFRCYTPREANPRPYLMCREDASLGRYLRRIVRQVDGSDFTLILNSCQSFDFELWDRLREFLAPLFAASGVSLDSDATLFLSRADTTVFGIHQEPYDNFFFQLQGHKHFHLWPPDRDLPMQWHRATEYQELLGDAMNVTLTPGDVLYMPSGYYHVADTEPGVMSLYLGVSLHTSEDLVLQLVRDEAVRLAKARIGARGRRTAAPFIKPRSKRPDRITLPTEMARTARAFGGMDLTWPVTTRWLQALSSAGFANIAGCPGFQITEDDAVVALRPDAILSASHGEDAAFPTSQALFGLIRRLNCGEPERVRTLLDEFAGDWDDLRVERQALLDLLVRIGRAHGLRQS